MKFDDLAPENDEEDEDVSEEDYESIPKSTGDLLLAFNVYNEEYVVYHELEISDGESSEVYCVKIFQSKDLLECIEFIRNFYEKEEDW